MYMYIIHYIYTYVYYIYIYFIGVLFTDAEEVILKGQECIL